MIISVFLLLVGFVGLVISAKLFVEGASKIAQILRLPTLLISLILVALGTSAPELVVSSVAAWKGSDIALSNVIGSNIANIALVAGLTAVVSPLIIKSKKYIVIMVIVEVVLALLLVLGNTLGKIDGLILFVLLVGYLFYSFRSNEEEPIPDEEKISKQFIFFLRFIPNEAVISGMFTVIGLAGLIFSGDLVVNSAVEIASFFGMSEALIGVTVVAIGTSLPELSTSIIAGIQKKYDIVLGNIIGSNIMNILLILAVSSVICPLHASKALWFQILAMLLISTVFALFSLKNKVGRGQGILLLITYAAFLTTALLVK